jgi:hypothetical protein
MSTLCQKNGNEVFWINNCANKQKKTSLTFLRVKEVNYSIKSV